jgi:hypothetical protein
MVDWVCVQAYWVELLIGALGGFSVTPFAVCTTFATVVLLFTSPRVVVAVSGCICVGDSSCAWSYAGVSCSCALMGAGLKLRRSSDRKFLSHALYLLYPGVVD